MSFSSCGIFTGKDHDVDLQPVRVVPAPGDSSMIRKQMSGAALELLRKAGQGLLDPDFDPWSLSVPPAEQFSCDHVAVSLSEEQMKFANALTGARCILDEHTERPLAIGYEVLQESSVPSDTILLNLWYYLSAEGHVVVPQVKRHGGGFIIQLIVKE